MGCDEGRDLARPLTLYLRRRVGRDIAAAKHWYAEQSPGLDLRFAQALDRMLGRIVDHPHLFPTLYRETRRAPVARFPYNVFYIVEAERIVVLAVIHQARDPSRWPAST